jgi:hypothetical protein
MLGGAFVFRSAAAGWGCVLVPGATRVYPPDPRIAVFQLPVQRGGLLTA